ncbi:MAG: methyl-accepting chemotaxis protein [Spirochaetaceae bacterium]|nr:methyl-accepting chemotaxis protein [Spirochaetaceae bacterium]
MKNLAAGTERAGPQEAAADIREIARESEGLLEITAVMDNIASQTNLLSMNAAIEAARGGDVIEESRNLELLTQEISLNMNGMSDRTDRISAAVQRVDDLSGENKRHIDVPAGEIHKFKTD